MARKIIWAPSAEHEKQHILTFYANRNQSWAYSIKINDAIENPDKLPGRLE